MATESEIRTQAEEFAALPRAERRATYESLPKPVKRLARKIVEARRGISHRIEGGIPVFTKDEYIRQLVRRQTKLNDMENRKEAVETTMAELRAQLSENWGEEALAEAEAALAELNS